MFYCAHCGNDLASQTWRRADTAVDAIKLSHMFLGMPERQPERRATFFFTRDHQPVTSTVGHMVRVIPASLSQAKMSAAAADLFDDLIKFLQRRQFGSTLYFRGKGLFDLRDFAIAHAVSIDEQIAADPGAKERFNREHWGEDAPWAQLSRLIDNGDERAFGHLRDFLARYQPQGYQPHAMED